MKSKRWNEHVKLTATLINAVAIGVLGVAVIGPLAQPDNPWFGFSTASEKVKLFNDSETILPWYAIIEWKAVLAALALHLLAHVALWSQKDE